MGRSDVAISDPIADVLRPSSNHFVLNTSHLGDLAISDGGFVFDPQTGHSYNLNETALAALRALKDGAEPEAIIARLRDQFSLEHDEDVARDVGDLISRLRELGLVS